MPRCSFEKTGGVLGYGIEFVPILGDSVMLSWVLVRRLVTQSPRLCKV